MGRRAGVRSELVRGAGAHPDEQEGDCGHAQPEQNEQHDRDPRRVAGQVEAASQSGATAPRIEHRIESAACPCDDRGRQAAGRAAKPARGRKGISKVSAQSPRGGRGAGG